VELANACELYRDAGFLGQPANGVTSLAFVVCGVAIAADRRRNRPLAYPLLVAAVGAGSFVQHGPNPDWQAYAHDLPLATLLAYVAADAAADLAGRRLPAQWPAQWPAWWPAQWPAWWLAVPVVMVPVVAAGPTASSAAQGTLAAAAIALNLLRARRRPRLRKTVIGAMLILGAGSLLGTLGDRTSLCQPDSLVQGHALWHLLAALALWQLAPAIGSRGDTEATTPARPEAERLRRPSRSRAEPPARPATPRPPRPQRTE
jgi:hypothetical protein